MIKPGMKLFDRAGNEVVVDNVNQDIICITTTLRVKTTYNDGSDIKYHDHKENYEHSMNDVGIHLFFEKEDIHYHENLTVNDINYMRNKEPYLELFSKNHSLFEVTENFSSDCVIVLSLTLKYVFKSI